MKKKADNYMIKEPFQYIESYHKKHPKWGLCKTDENIERWNFLKNVDMKILYELKSFESMAWQEILSASGGRKSGNNNHFVQVNKLSIEVRQELKKIKCIDLQEIFSLRISNKIRIYGIIDENTGFFNILWLDKEHEIYPMSNE